jgi:hypothetical protein
MKSKCGQFFQYLQYAPWNWIRMHTIESPMCLSSLVACEKDPITWWALANENWAIWESHVSERCFPSLFWMIAGWTGSGSGGEGNYNYYIQLKDTMDTGCKKHGFFQGALWSHKGDVAGWFEVLSSACQIVNNSMQPEQKKIKQSSCLSCDFFQIIISVTSYSLRMYLKSKWIAQRLYHNHINNSKLSIKEYLFLC